MPATFLTLPRELRDEIYIYPALASSFAFLLTCRQINEEGTPLLYKHGIYRVCSLDFSVNRLPVPPKPPPFRLVQNLNIAISSGNGHAVYETYLRTLSLLAQFAGTEVHRRVCNVNVGNQFIPKDMARVLCGLDGFEVVRVETFRIGSWSAFITEAGIERGLGKAEWKPEQKRPTTETTSAVEKLIVEFRPRKFKAMNGSEGVGRVQSME